jgi:xanthine/uracil/vitamin C permease (AzgA family)
MVAVCTLSVWFEPCHLLMTCRRSYFRVTERGSTVATEIKAGIVTFLTMSYILLVNPQILSAAGTAIDPSWVLWHYSSGSITSMTAF